MANIKSAKKRILVNRTKADRNKAIKSGVKTAIKKVYTAIDAKDKEAAAAALLIRLQQRAYIIRIMLQEKFPVYLRL